MSIHEKIRRAQEADHDKPLIESKFRRGLTDSNCVSFGEPPHLIFTTREVKRIDHAALRRFAAASDNEEVSGRSTRLELIDYFVGQTTLPDFRDLEQ